MAYGDIPTTEKRRMEDLMRETAAADERALHRDVLAALQPPSMLAKGIATLVMAMHNKGFRTVVAEDGLRVHFETTEDHPAALEIRTALRKQIEYLYNHNKFSMTSAMEEMADAAQRAKLTALAELGESPDDGGGDIVAQFVEAPQVVSLNP